jgi:hypothetical protein
VEITFSMPAIFGWFSWPMESKFIC